MKRFGAFLLGIIIGWILLIGGIGVALFMISPSSLGIDLKDEWVTDSDKKLEDTSFVDIIIKGVSLATTENLTLQDIKDTYGIDILEEVGLGGEEYASLKTQSLDNILNNPSEAFADVKLTDVITGDLLGDIAQEIPTALIEIWNQNQVKLGDLFGEDPVSVLLQGVKLTDLAPNLSSSTGLMKILANMDLSNIYQELKAEGGDLVKLLCKDVFVGEVMNYDFKHFEQVSSVEEAISQHGFSAVISGQVYSLDGSFYRVRTLNDETIFYLADLTCSQEHTHTQECYLPAWVDANDKDATALMNTFASIQLNDLLSGNFEIEEELKDVKVGEILNCTYDESGNFWIDANGEKATAIFNNIYGKTLEEMQEGIDTQELLAGIKVRDVINVTSDDTMLLQIIADKDILELSSNIENIYCGEIKEFEMATVNVDGYVDFVPGIKQKIEGSATLYAKQHVDGKWYEAEFNCIKADHTDTNNHNADCFDFVWYNYDSSVEGNYVKVSGMDKVLANIKLSAFDVNTVMGKIKNLPFTEIISDTNGAFSLIDSNTPIKDLSKALTQAVNSKSVGELMQSGLLTVSSETQSTFDTVIPNWKNMTITQFLDAISTLLNASI